MKNILTKVMFIGLIVILAACSNEGEASSGKGEHGDWPEEIAIVQMPNEENPNAASMHDQLREHLQSELDIDVVEYEGGSYAVGIEAMASGNIDGHTNEFLSGSTTSKCRNPRNAPVRRWRRILYNFYYPSRQ